MVRIERELAAVGQCATHQLPLDRRGECQLCRLGQIPSAPPPARASRWIGAALVGLVLAGIGLLVAAFDPTTPEPPERGVSPRVGATPTDRPNDEASAATAGGAVVRFEEDPGIEPDGMALDGTLDDGAGERNDREPGLAEEPIDGQARLWALARDEVAIQLYVRDDCEACTQASDYMRSNGIAFEERDIERDPAADRRIRELSPERAVPLFELDDTVMIGFAPDRFEAMRTQAATKHLQDEF